MGKSFDNLDNALPSSADIRETQARFPVEEITQDEDLKVFYRQREINRQVPEDKTAYLDRFANEKLTEYKAANGNIRVFAVKEAGKIIAAAKWK